MVGAGGNGVTGATKSRHTRTKTGCSTCRTRRKKCSEERPVCAGCKRNGLLCQWPAKRQLLGTGGSSSEPFESTSSSPHSEQSLEPTDGYDELVTTWKPSLNAFVLSNGARATSLYPTSGSLLSHYLLKTGPVCSHRPAHHNPFITQILPLATTDDLLMNTVLALSGVHRAHQQDKFSQVNVDAHKHYGLALQALRSESLVGLSGWNYEKSLRLLLVLLLLAHTEAIRGDRNGSIFPHLRACRPLIVTLLERSGPDNQTHLSALEGFVVEMYVYLVVESRIVPDDMSMDRSLENDTFLASLNFLKKYPGSGMFIDFGPDLFEKIIVVANLASERLAHFNDVQNSFRFGDQPGGIVRLDVNTHQAKVFSVLTEVEAWQPPPIPPADIVPRPDGFLAIGEAYRLALIIYIKTCCIIDPATAYTYDPSNLPNACGIYYPIPTPQLRAEIATITARISAPLMIVIKAPHGAVALWPWIISASCYTTDEFRYRAFKEFDKPENEYGNLSMVDEIRAMLEALWNDKDPRAYGPFGIQRLMQNNAFNLSIA